MQESRQLAQKYRGITASTPGPALRTASRSQTGQDHSSLGSVEPGEGCGAPPAGLDAVGTLPLRCKGQRQACPSLFPPTQSSQKPPHPVLNKTDGGGVQRARMARAGIKDSPRGLRTETSGRADSWLYTTLGLPGTHTGLRGS